MQCPYLFASISTLSSVQSIHAIIACKSEIAVIPIMVSSVLFLSVFLSHLHFNRVSTDYIRNPHVSSFGPPQLLLN